MISLTNKTVLITGGTGTFGSAFAQRLLSYPYNDLKKVIVFSRDENKQHIMRDTINDPRLEFELGDIRDKDRVYQAMKGVDFVFNAAALKQVPSCEFFPLEAVKTNILGTQNVLEAAIHHKVKKVICLSTDKAVYPTSVMGMTKAVMEKIALNFAKSQTTTDICITRYGNIMYSRGSVIPVFMQQLREGKPLTITNPNMTRFLMNRNDAMNLVLYALHYGKTGHTYVMKAKSCSIGTLAQAVMCIISKEKGACFPTEPILTGERHGEKLTEDMISAEEAARAESEDNFFIIPPDNRSMRYGSNRITHPTVKSYNSNDHLIGVEDTILLLESAK